LKMNSLFTVELVMPGDTTSQQLPEEQSSYDKEIIGYEGNGILSKFDFVETKGLVVQCARHIKHKFKTHNEAVAVCEIPGYGCLGCYCIHLDTYGTGVKGRAKQFLEILEDVSAQRSKYEQTGEKNEKNFYQIVGGDLNTLCHGMARIIPKVACDWHSVLGTLGYCEAGYFQENAVDYGNKIYGLSLSDPFDKNKDITFNSLKGFYKGKLDWLLISKNLHPLERKVCPLNDRCSDHQWILVDAQLS